MIIVGRMDEGMCHLILLAVPLFVFLGLLIEMTGMARAMVRFPREPARPCPRRPLLRADRRDVSRLRHLRLQGRGHGGGRARRCSRRCSERGAKPGDLVALLSATGAQTETIPPSHRAHHHRLGDRRLDRRAFHRRAVPGARARGRRSASSSRGATGRRPVAMSSAPLAARSRGPSSSRCRRSPCPSSSAPPWSKASPPRPRSRPSASPTRSSPAF